MKFDHSKNKKDPDWKEIVNIVNLTTADTEKYDIPHSFALPSHNTHPTIAFNKQGTHIIVHGNDHDKLQDLSWDEIKQNPIRHHIIFPITLNTPKTCPLSTLPTDVLDHIASYLTFDVETEQEFIDKIYPLTINTPNPDVDTKKTFINYFKQKLILKDPAKQITLTK